MQLVKTQRRFEQASLCSAAESEGLHTHVFILDHSLILTLPILHEGIFWNANLFFFCNEKDASCDCVKEVGAPKQALLHFFAVG